MKDGSIEKTSLFTFDQSIENKDTRSQVHSIFKSTGVYETDTLMEGTSRRIRVFLTHALSQNKRRKLNIVNRKPDGQEDMPQYLKVIVQKTNVDTMQAIHYIAKKLKKFGKSF